MIGKVSPPGAKRMQRATSGSLVPKGVADVVSRHADDGDDLQGERIDLEEPAGRV